MRKSTHSNTRVLHYSLTIGDLQEAFHVFVDLLEMRVLSHHEFHKGNADGDDVHYEGPWSRTLVGYTTPSESEDLQVSIQLTVNHGIAKYVRGNQLHAIEIQISDTLPLDDAGVSSEIIRGKKMYAVTCDGYTLHVRKSSDGKQKISRVILNTNESIRMSRRTVQFWVECLGFEIVAWSSYFKTDNNDFFRANEKNSCCCCNKSGKISQKKLKNTFKPLESGELPYVELNYGSSKDFHVRLQSLPEEEHLFAGVATERLILTCTEDRLNLTMKLVETLGLEHGGVGERSPFQFAPDKPSLFGFIVRDPAGLEVCFFNDKEIRAIANEVQLNSEGGLKASLMEKIDKLIKKDTKKKFDI